MYERKVQHLEKFPGVKLTCPKWLSAVLHLKWKRFYHSVDVTYKEESST